MWETQVRFLGWEDPLEKEMAIHSSTLAWKIPWTESLIGYSPWGRKESDTTEQLHFHCNLTKIFLKKYKLIYVMSIIKRYLLGQWTSITKRGVFSWVGL